MALPLSPKGLVLLLTPYAGSVFYRFGKWILEKLGSFPYGREIPVHTLKPILPDTMELALKERSVGFVILIFNAPKALSNAPLVGRLFFLLNQLLNPLWCSMLRVPVTRSVVFFVDRILSRIFGGYLLLSVCKKKSVPFVATNSPDCFS
jgi:hypothetical protein